MQASKKEIIDMVDSNYIEINATSNGKPLDYKALNERIHEAIKKGYKKIIINDVCGQRFIGASLQGDLELIINGLPGNDLGIFMDGPRIIVNGNSEDQAGNTMNDGNIIIDGDGGDVIGLSARGGKIYIKKDVGYRIGIHMKEFQEKIPSIIIGGTPREFFGEYMAGGILISLRLNIESGNVTNQEEKLAPNIGSGIHGGSIFIRGDIPDSYLGIGAVKMKINEEDNRRIAPILKEFCSNFNIDEDFIWNESFFKIFPGSHRPYATYYTAKPI